MGKRTIIECDLCHNESSDDDLVTFSFKHPSKAKGRTYDVCKGCATTLETQLVGSNQLPAGWGFGGGKATEKIASQTQAASSETTAQRRARLESTEPSADDLFIKEKAGDGPTIEVTEERTQERVGSGPATVQAVGKDGSCLHYNKTPPMLGTIGGQKGFVQRCKECNELISLRSADERHSASKVKNQ